MKLTLKGKINAIIWGLGIWIAFALIPMYAYLVGIGYFK